MGDYSKPIQTSLRERQRLVKMFKQYSIAKRVDFDPTTLIGWMDAMGYLNIESIKGALEKEKEEFEDV